MCGTISMLLDRFSEAIAHFIGLFQLGTEAARGRLEYDGFRAAQSYQDLHPLLALSANRNVTFGPEGHDPKVGNPMNHLDAKGHSTLKVKMADLPRPPVPYVPEDAGLSTFTTFPALPPAPDLPDMVEAPPPGSTFYFTLQANTLSDRDRINVDVETAEEWSAAQAEVLSSQMAKAKSLQLLELDSIEDFVSHDPAEAEALAATLKARAETMAEAHPEAEIAFYSGSEAEGDWVSGEAVETLPDWSDYLPEAPQPNAPSSTAGTSGQASQGQATSGVGLAVAAVAAESEETAESSPPHVLDTGHNQLLNSVQGTTTGVDAPVIAVAGSVTSLDVISQINLLMDDSADPGAQNLLHNSASLSGSPQAPTEAAPLIEASTATTGLPGLVALATIEGDLVNYSWTHQINTAIDDDAVSYLTSATQSFIVTGQNQLVNITGIFDFGMGFDLILVGGNMMSQYIIQQTNVLLDQDWVQGGISGQGTGGFAPGVNFDSGGNVAINSASITHTALDSFSALNAPFRTVLDGFDPTAPNLMPILNSALLGAQEVLSVLYISGNLIDLHMVSQVNILSDADLVLDGMAMPGAQITTGGNATVNSAHLLDMGIGSQIMAGGPIYSDAVLYQANLISTDAPPTDVFLAPPSEGLASEAVAFLATDGGESAAESSAFGEAAAFQLEGPVHADVMQTMLA